MNFLKFNFKFLSLKKIKNKKRGGCLALRGWFDLSDEKLTTKSIFKNFKLNFKIFIFKIK
jgi:hypothetical protein